MSWPRVCFGCRLWRPTPFFFYAFFRHPTMWKTYRNFLSSFHVL